MAPQQPRLQCCGLTCLKHEDPERFDILLSPPGPAISGQVLSGTSSLYTYPRGLNFQRGGPTQELQSSRVGDGSGYSLQVRIWSHLVEPSSLQALRNAVSPIFRGVTSCGLVPAYPASIRMRSRPVRGSRLPCIHLRLWETQDVLEGRLVEMGPVSTPSSSHRPGQFAQCREMLLA